MNACFLDTWGPSNLFFRVLGHRQHCRVKRGHEEHSIHLLLIMISELRDVILVQELNLKIPTLPNKSSLAVVAVCGWHTCSRNGRF